MEITNSLIPTLSQADSPNQLSEGNPRAKNAKKKGQEDAAVDSSMEALLANILSQQNSQTKGPSGDKTLGGQNAELISKLRDEAAAKVELSTKNVAGKNPDGGAAGASGGPAPTIATLLQAKAQQNASGRMADALVAGPGSPWGNHWVFGGLTPEDMNAMKTSEGGLDGHLTLESMKKLAAAAKSKQVKGGDETQLKQAGESTAADLAALLERVGQYGSAEIEGVQTDALAKPSKQGANFVSGGEYLSAMAAGKAEAGKTPSIDGRAGMHAAPQGQLHANFLQNLNGVEGASLASPTMKAAPAATVSRPDLQVIPGGLSGGLTEGRLEGGLRSSKEEMKPVSYETVYMANAPMHGRGAEQMGPIPPQTVTGHVVPGAMMKERLTSESLHNVATGIQGMSGRGGGEMRIKLNPENLGELTIRVSTNGKDVGLKVQASDPGAKKILEESIGSLRDSLAGQSLALGRVDVVVASNDASNAQTGQQDSQSSLNNQWGGQWADQNRSNQGAFDPRNGSNGGQWGDDESTSRPIRNTVAGAAPTRAAYASARAADSRLDVMA